MTGIDCSNHPRPQILKSEKSEKIEKDLKAKMTMTRQKNKITMSDSVKMRPDIWGTSTIFNNST